MHHQMQIKTPVKATKKVNALKVAINSRKYLDNKGDLHS